MACSISILLRTPDLVVGRFRCTPDDPRWWTVNAVTDAVHVVFPWTSVVIEQLGSEAVLANPNHVLFFNPEQPYRRTVHDRRGDDAIFVEVSPEVVAASLRSGEGELPFRHGPSDAQAYLLHYAAVRELMADATDTLHAEELVHDAVARSIEARCTPTGRISDSASPSTGSPTASPTWPRWPAASASAATAISARRSGPSSASSRRSFGRSAGVVRANCAGS